MYFRKTLKHKELGEFNDSPSLTVPGDSLTIPEIFRRFATGTLPAVSKQPQYLEEHEIESRLMEDSPYDGQSRDLTDLDLNQNRIDALLADLPQKSDTKATQGKTDDPATTERPAEPIGEPSP